MRQSGVIQDSQADGCRWEKPAGWAVRFVQALFLIVLLLDLDGPFVSAHNERQNQTFGVALHVFHDGWRSIVTPKASFSMVGFETQPFTAVLQEFPFHGVIGWPLTLVAGHERAVVRLVSTAFALISIQLLYWILRFWLPPAPAAAGAALWATAPMTLHFGQVPMPDILCTAGMLAAFWFALRGKLPASSGCFLFMILAKPTVIAFGLPILVALLAARNCRSRRNFLQLSLAWGWLPLTGLLLWLRVLYWFAPPTPLNIKKILLERGDWFTLLLPSFHKLVLGCLLPFGLGVLGFVGLVFALRREGPKMDPRVKWAIISSNLLYLILIVRKVHEPQYMLPMLAWCVVPASFGFNLLMDKLRAGTAWRIALGVALMMHVLAALAFTVDLKTSRVPNFPDIERAARLLPPDARVVVVYRFFGPSAAVWLNRNVVSFNQAARMEGHFPELRRIGFTHVLLLDIESWHESDIEGRHEEGSAHGPLALAEKLLQRLRPTPSVTGASAPGFADPANPFRQYCDRHFSPLFVAPHVVLYAMTSPPASNSRLDVAAPADGRTPAWQRLSPSPL